ncbi:peroxisomal membrane protein PEX16 [Coccinella septempunctata]|uniref:peroxisomal membrane protein PEX16 n=1 Tax=Coccinella septempunctata TaxID=41139 RepID=UPI001D063030|nr:peroxisomal membrane protein PEX16 [Coccinella septempunctata]
MSIPLNLSDLFNSYKSWVSKNPQITTDFETTARWLSYFIAGRINSSHIVSELVYCLSNLLILYNDRIISELRQLNTFKSGEKLKLYLTVLEYSEVFLELSAQKKWGEKGRWLVICVIQLFKCISKLILVHHYKEPLIQYPVIPVLERKKLNQVNDGGSITVSEICQQGSVSFKLKRSGRLIRKVEASPPVNLRSWKPLPKEINYDSENLENVEQALLDRMLAAETIYLVKPVAHLGSMIYFGEKSWTPYILALMFDLCSLQLYHSCDKTKSNTLSVRQKVILSKRTTYLMLYLIRSPFFNKYSRDKINKLLNGLGSNVPFASLICNQLIKYLPFYQSNYFYMWSS